MANFNIGKFLIENKLTTASKRISEQNDKDLSVSFQDAVDMTEMYLEYLLDKKPDAFMQYDSDGETVQKYFVKPLGDPGDWSYDYVFEIWIYAVENSEYYNKLYPHTESEEVDRYVNDFLKHTSTPEFARKYQDIHEYLRDKYD